MLKELLRRCKAVLANHSKAVELLPTQSGFFFGGTEYDQWYFSDLEQTVKIIEPLIKDDENEYSYRASW